MRVSGMEIDPRFGNLHVEKNETTSRVPWIDLKFGRIALGGEFPMPLPERTGDTQERSREVMRG
jgi:hypothetical protein